MFKDLLTQAAKVLGENSPRILTAMAAAGVVTTAVLAVQATPEAIRIIERERHHRWLDNAKTESEEDIVIDKIDLVKLTWKCYIPAVSVGVVAIGCIIGMNSVHARRTAALASAYSVTEKAMQEYQRKVVKHLGLKGEQNVRDEIAQDKLDRHPVSDSQVIVTGGGEVLCYDDQSGRYFKSDVERLHRIENEVNRRLINGTWLSLNELYSEMGLESIRLGDDLGWVPDNLVQFKLTARVASDGTPCIVVGYEVEPKYNPYSSY